MLLCHLIFLHFPTVVLQRILVGCPENGNEEALRSSPVDLKPHADTEEGATGQSDPKSAAPENIITSIHADDHPRRHVSLGEFIA